MSERRRPAGVDPSVLESVNDELEDEVAAFGRRAAWKILGANGAPGSAIRQRFDRIAAVVEAEIRSSSGTPAGDVIVACLSYAEGVQIATAIVEAIHSEVSATETEILAELRGKFFLALGIYPSCRMGGPNPRSP